MNDNHRTSLHSSNKKEGTKIGSATGRILVGTGTGIPDYGITRSDPLYDRNRFLVVELAEATNQLVDPLPEEGLLEQLNVMLLRDAYAGAIQWHPRLRSSRPPSRASAPSRSAR